jgi:hypothetical protein
MRIGTTATGNAFAGCRINDGTNVTTMVSRLGVAWGFADPTNGVAQNTASRRNSSPAAVPVLADAPDLVETLDYGRTVTDRMLRNCQPAHMYRRNAHTQATSTVLAAYASHASGTTGSTTLQARNLVVLTW